MLYQSYIRIGLLYRVLKCKEQYIIIAKWKLCFIELPAFSFISHTIHIYCLSRIKENRNIYTHYNDTIHKIHNINPCYQFFLNYLIKICFDVCIYLLIQIFYSTSFYCQEIQSYKIYLLNIICNNCLKLYS